MTAQIKILLINNLLFLVTKLKLIRFLWNNHSIFQNIVLNLWRNKNLIHSLKSSGIDEINIIINIIKINILDNILWNLRICKFILTDTQVWRRELLCQSLVLLNYLCTFFENAWDLSWWRPYLVLFHIHILLIIIIKIIWFINS